MVDAMTAMNLTLREDYARDSQRGVDRFNKLIREAGVDFTLHLPHPAFNRNIGVFRGVNATPEGRLIGAAEWRARRRDWLPTTEDYAFVRSLMVKVTEPGRVAGWIAPPRRGIHGQPVDFAYVLFH
jgi:benzoyl-CoA 2,3-dioxygenase component B